MAASLVVSNESSLKAKKLFIPSISFLEAGDICIEYHVRVAMIKFIINIASTELFVSMIKYI